MPTTSWTPNAYPPARRSDHVDIYKSASRGEVHVADPYQWLEEYTDETEKWTSAQQAFTRKHLDKNSHCPRLEKVFQAANDFAKFTAPYLHTDNRWYWLNNSGLEPQTALYRSRDSTLPDFSKGNDLVGEIFFDPNALSKDGTSALASYKFSECGKYFAYGISVSGSDFVTLYIRSTDSPVTKNEDGHNRGRLPEELKFVKFSSITWTPDSKGIFYQRYPDNSTVTNDTSTIATQGDVDAMVYYHPDDILVYQDKTNPSWMFSTEITDDGKYLILYLVKDSSRQNLLWVADFDANNIGPNIKWNKVIDEFVGEYDVLTNKGSVFYLRTNLCAPQYKVITIDVAKGNEVKDLIPESEAFLSDIMSVNRDFFVLTYKRNVQDEINIFSHTGAQVARVAEDFVGAALTSGREKQSWFFVTMNGFTDPCSVGRYDFAAPQEHRWSIIRTTKLNGLDPDDFEAQQVWYESKDGTKVPMFIVRHKSTKFDGTAPALQYGYGGFALCINPFFSPTFLTFLQTYGCILAVPSIRGGGEFGEDWHQGGCRETKVNCFDDFIAATEYLVKNKYAAPGKVAINGGSNGGLLVAACVNRAPEGTFGVAVADVGVLDLLKFHKFTIGGAWTSDYGNPDDPIDFDFIYPISPLHNIPTDKVLPPMLLLTADHDDRVVPAHTFKMAAALQHALPHNPNPILMRVDKKAGHGAGKSTQQRIMESADKWGFVAESLGLEWKNPAGQAKI
ncbi:prolyl oligopeptidase [Crassisporium funariophilum]|nr:prolyl oligopeptidase [Crassisporium funariophilum]